MYEDNINNKELNSCLTNNSHAFIDELSNKRRKDNRDRQAKFRLKNICGSSNDNSRRSHSEEKISALSFSRRRSHSEEKINDFSFLNEYENTS